MSSKTTVQGCGTWRNRYVVQVRMTRVAARLGIAVAMMMLQSACTEKVPLPNAPGPPRPLVTPDSVQVIFNDNCAFSGCHGSSSPAAGLDLSASHSYDALVGVSSQTCGSLSRVTPFKPDSSCLIKRLTGEVTPRMPPGGSSLTGAQVTAIRGWIQQGAGPASPPAAPTLRVSRGVAAGGHQPRTRGREFGWVGHGPLHSAFLIVPH